MSGPLVIDTARVGALARALADAGDGLHAAARRATELAPPTSPVLGADAPPSDATGWGAVAARHEAGISATAATVTALADRLAAVSDAIVAAVADTVAQDSAGARAIGGPAGDLR